MTSIQPKTTENSSFDLEQPEIKTDKTADDCISRQEAIEAFEPTHYIDWYTPTIIETLEALPSVQPEVLACGNGELVEASRRLVEASPNDLISRQQAIDAMASWDWQELYLPIHFKQVLEELPSAYPEITRCKDCKWFGGIGCAIKIVDDSDKPKEEDFCSFAER